MQIIKNRAIVEDNWSMLADDALAAGDIVVPFSRWLAESDALKAHAGKVAVFVEGDQDIDQLSEEASNFELIVINFKLFGDGRGYSIARLLRERFNYQGEIRATGDVLHDQLGYMLRCGFNSFAMCEGQDLENALNAFEDFTQHYQTAADKAQPISHQRHR